MRKSPQSSPFPAPRRVILLTLSSVLALALLASGSLAALPAFPGAEGFGAVASGGRGGQVLKVTTLAASGPGSLQWALDQAGPRVIVFAVSGVIASDIRIPHGDVTIAGQSAPGVGITIAGHLYTPYGDTFGNIILRHLRVRPPVPDADWPPIQHDSIQLSTVHTLIFDHIDASHAADEILDLWGGARDITVQWSMLGFSLPHAGQPNHNFALINGPGGGRISVHHNLFAHNRARTPAISDGPADVVNNVVFNGREGFVHHNPAVGDFNLVGNLYLAGPSAVLAPLWFDPENGPDVPTRYYVWDNHVEGPGEFVGRVDDPYTTPGFGSSYTFACCGIEASQFNAWGAFDYTSHAGYVPIATQAPAAAYPDVLARAGAFPRDAISRWSVEETEGRTGSYGDRRPSSWLEGLVLATPPPDLDDDGMADAWEGTHGLDPTDGTDHATVMPSGYTAIEEYLNELAEALVAGQLFHDGFESGGVLRWQLEVFESAPGQ